MYIAVTQKLCFFIFNVCFFLENKTETLRLEIYLVGEFIFHIIIDFTRDISRKKIMPYPYNCCNVAVLFVNPLRAEILDY